MVRFQRPWSTRRKYNVGDRGQPWLALETMVTHDKIKS